MKVLCCFLIPCCLNPKSLSETAFWDMDHYDLACLHPLRKVTLTEFGCVHQKQAFREDLKVKEEVKIERLDMDSATVDFETQVLA